MALVVLLLAGSASLGAAATSRGEMVLANVTRSSTGDFFSLVGSDCGPTRCMELSHGTALTALDGEDSCVCQCRRETPAFREDQRTCVNNIEECPMATFGRGAKKPQIPFVFLPMKGQIIYPSKEIVFTDVDDAICAVTSAQYLSPSGWVTLRDLLDNDVPFSLYRDEGSTFLQWRGSSALHARLEGRLVAAHVLCSAPAPTRLAASCAAFRVSGASYNHNSLLDVHSISFHAGEIVTSEPSTQNQGLSVLESLAIGICVLLLIFVYAAGIIFYIHYKQRQKRKQKDPEMNTNTMSSTDGSNIGSRIDLDNVMLKTNPLLKFEGMGGLGGDFNHDAGLSDVSERTEDTIDSAASTASTQKFQKMNSNVISAMVHSRRKKPSRPSIRSVSSPDRIMERIQRRSASPEIERAPHSDLAIVDCSNERDLDRQSSPSSIGEPALRRKLYFNPVFFETEHLKNPPPAAVEFLEKIREVMSIAKDKMTTKRFIPILSDIPEEESYHTIDLGWDIPCARRGRRFSVISLKRENSRRSGQCSGCPGCGNKESVPKPALTRSNSCKSCVSEDYRQNIVRKWLDEVPSPSPRTSTATPIKSVAKVSGTPRAIEPKKDLSDSSPELPRSRTPDLLRDSSDCDSQRVKSSELKRTIRSPVSGSHISSPEPRVYSPEPNRIAPKRVISPGPKRTRSQERLHISSPEITPRPRRIRSPVPMRESSPDTMSECSSRLSRAKSPEPGRVKSPSRKEDDSKRKPLALIEAAFKDAMRVKENAAKKEKVEKAKAIPEKTKFAFGEKPTIIHNVPLDKENNMTEAPDIPTKTDTIQIQEKVIPSSHASRRIRKKLPPPPPPPVIPPKPAALKPQQQTSFTYPQQETSFAKPQQQATNIKPQQQTFIIKPQRSLIKTPQPTSIKPSQLMPEIKIESASEVESSIEDGPPIPPEIKMKMEAVIKELSKCRRIEPKEVKTEEINIETETIEPIPPKIVIPVVAAPDSHYFSDDNLLTDRRKNVFVQREPFVDMDSLERNMLKRRRFSLACGPEMVNRLDLGTKQDLQSFRETLTRSWRDVRKADSYHFVPKQEPMPKTRSFTVSEVFIDTSDCEPLYDNIAKPGPLTIQVRGSPLEIRKNVEEFDPDTLDRKPRVQAKKRVEKILLRSGGSFKHKAVPHECMKQVTKSSPIFNRKIGSLRQIYEAKTKSQQEETKRPYYERRGSMPHVGNEFASLVKTVKTADLIRHLEAQNNIKPPLAPKQKRGCELSPKLLRHTPPEERRRSPEERERYQNYLRGENLKRSGRRSNRTRSRRTDIRKFYRTEDSGYLSTDSNESKRRANYLMQLRPKLFPEQTNVPVAPSIVRTPILQHIESDTDDMESICDGRSESGGESIETDSVFFGNFDESKQMLADLEMTSYENNRKLGHQHHDQIDSGFMGETNIILSGDSDSEHRSVISITTGRDGRASAASITHLSDDPYTHSVEC
ncbi:hypothetical protein O0L34_g7768 [Tuta absoluta]|nr:hypothetical protein O0L34_g7768 [Tuta absoluta]